MTNVNRLLRWGPVALWCAALFAASSIPAARMPSAPILSQDKLIHAAVYFVLGALVMRALGRYALTVLAVAAYGLSDELHQLLTPGRACELWDWIADLSGGLLGAAFVLAIVRARGRRPAGDG